MGDIATLHAGLASEADTVPLCNPQQHLRALEHANRVRLARAQLKRQIGAGELAADRVITSCPWEARSMSISDVLMSQKRWGRARCRRLLLSIGVPENKQLCTLTDRQRLALAAVLREMGPPAPPSAPASPRPPTPPSALPRVESAGVLSLV